MLASACSPLHPLCLLHHKSSCLPLHPSGVPRRWCNRPHLQSSLHRHLQSLRHHQPRHLRRRRLRQGWASGFMAADPWLHPWASLAFVARRQPPPPSPRSSPSLAPSPPPPASSGASAFECTAPLRHVRARFLAVPHIFPAALPHCDESENHTQHACRGCTLGGSRWQLRAS